MALILNKYKKSIINGVLKNSDNYIYDFSNIISVGNRAMGNLCYNNTTIKKIIFDNLTSIGSNGLQYCCYGCKSLITAPTFANLTSVGNYGLYYCFQNCTSLTTAPTFANLTSTETNGLQNCFYNCSSLTTAPTFANLTSIENYGLQYCFHGCKLLTIAPTFANLTSVGNYGLQRCFSGCTSLTTLSFPKLNSTSFGTYINQFNNMLSGVTGCTVHFPSNLQSVIGSWSDVTAGFGGTNTTVLFDLTATS